MVSSESLCISYPTQLSQDYDTLYEWLVDEIDFSIPRAIIAESFSSPIAIRLAAAFPDTIQAVVIAGGFCSSPAPSFLRFAPLRAIFSFPPPKKLIRYFLLDRESDDSLLEEVKKSTSQLPAKSFAQRVRAILTLNRSDFQLIHDTPVLVLQASRDQVIDSKTQQSIEQVAPNARVHWIDAPHLIFQQKPVHCAKLITHFLKSKFS